MTGSDTRARLDRALNNIDLRVHSKLGSDEVLQAALDGFVEALEADAGDIKQFDGTEWIVTHVRGFDAGVVGTRLTVPNAPVASRAAETRHPVAITDYLAEPDSFYVGFPRMHHLRATLAVPLFIREEVVGCLFAWMRNESRAYSEAEVDFGRRVAGTVALALANARLYEAEHAARARAETSERRLQEELQRTHTLLRASRELTNVEDVDELLERLARIVLDATGISRAFVNLIDVNRRVLTPKVATGGLVTPLGDAIDFEQLSEASQAAIRGARTVVLDYELPETPERDRAIARANRARRVLFVPLVHKGEIIGHISLDEPDVRCEFAPEQIEIVESIATQAAVVIQNARLFEREHTIAETLQTALLSPPEQIDGIEVAYLYRPASSASNVGGDFYDFFALDERSAAVLIGDVSGKGVDAAQLTTLIRDGARAYLFESAVPCGVLDKLNLLAHRFTPADKFATVVLGVLDCETGDFVHCGAGHPAPVVVGRDGARALATQPGLVGAFPDMRFDSAQTRIAPGEVLVMFTDGLTEARRDSEMWGEAGVLDTLDRHRQTPVAELPEALLGASLDYCGGRLSDDVVILCIKRNADRRQPADQAAN